MTRWKTITDLELMKLISDPRRNRIIHLCEEKPLTVKELAEKLGEVPSRLYYHVNKLVEHELLEVAETRQHGNLTEKSYRAINYRDVMYHTDRKLLADAPQAAMTNIREMVDPGLSLFERYIAFLKETKEQGGSMDQSPIHVTIDSGSDYITGREWSDALRRVHQAWDPANEVAPWPQEWIQQKDLDEKGTYQYVLISYRIEDAQRLGLIPPFGDGEGGEDGQEE